LKGRLSAGAAGICARARAAKQNGSHMGVELGTRPQERVVQVAQKKEISGKKIVQFDEKILFDFF
jgi:hypothetical protein